MISSKGQDDIILQMFLVCLGFGLRLRGFSCSWFPSVALKHSPPWGRQHQFLPIFKFPLCYKYFSTSGTVSGFHSAPSTETCLRRVAKNSLVAQSSGFFLISFPLELCPVVDTADQLLSLALLFLCFLILVPWFSWLWSSCLTSLLHLFLFHDSPLDALQSYHSSLFSGHKSPWQACLLASLISATASATTFSKPNLVRSLPQRRTLQFHCWFQDEAHTPWEDSLTPS